MNETTFENARVGDRVWSSRYGWGTINSRQDNTPCPLAIWFDGGYCHGFFINGHGLWDILRTLFWNEVKFEAPPRPKRMVKKVVEGWVNVQEMETGINHCQPPLWRTCKEALSKRAENCIYLGEPLFIHHEYEGDE